jgi:hypothetical protein
VKLSYETAAKEIGGLFLPAGEAWRVAWKRDPDLHFYGPDGFHPSPLGSLLAACDLSGHHRHGAGAVARRPTS